MGCRVALFWPDDGKYYGCTVEKHLQQQSEEEEEDHDDGNENGKNPSSYFQLKYDDGEIEKVDMATEKFKFIDDDEHLNDDDDNDTNEGQKKKKKKKAPSDAASASGTKRRRSIQESDDDDDDDEEEYEWKDNDTEDHEDEESAFDADPQDDEDDAEDWMVTDDEDDLRGNRKKSKKSTKQKKTLKVTHHHTTSTDSGGNGQQPSSTTPPAAKRSKTTGSSSSTTTTNNNAAATLKTPLRQFAHTVSPKTTSSQKGKSSSTAAAAAVPKLSNMPTAATASSATKSNPPPFHPSGVVNIRGSHVHNHLKFLQNPKDSKGRSSDHPQYDPRTLQVNRSDWKKVTNSEMTAAVEQWWDLKSQYYDTVLLFKTGKFYEMFHMDADVGVEVLGLTYMKGKDAHAGFPEISYGSMADKLVRAGYKVARVEQTETPDQMKARNDKLGKGMKKRKVVNREVCSIMTLGTRTFCALDDQSALMHDQATNSASSGCGPLLSIREVLIDNDSNMEVEGDDSAQAVCEYGVTLVDAIRGTVVLGMFADDVLRSRMHTLLNSFAPSEILIQGGNNDEEATGASPILVSLLRAYQTNSRSPCRIETIRQEEMFPKSTALDKDHRQQLERPHSVIHPWDVEETLDELHRKKYYPRGSRQAGSKSISRWPFVLKAVVEGEVNLCLSSFGAALFYLQRNLIDHELLSMGIIKAYIPHPSPAIEQNSITSSITSNFFFRKFRICCRPRRYHYRGRQSSLPSTHVGCRCLS